MEDQAMRVELRKEHEWLGQMVGEWMVEVEMPAKEGEAPGLYQGRETVRSLGGAWVVCEGVMGDDTSVMTLGFDPQRGRFVGTFVGSMMTNMWVYDGEADPSGASVVLATRGPSFGGPGMADYRDVVEIVSPDHRTLTSTYQGEDGEWHPVMTAHYRRVS